MNKGYIFYFVDWPENKRAPIIRKIRECINNSSFEFISVLPEESNDSDNHLTKHYIFYLPSDNVIPRSMWEGSEDKKEFTFYLEVTSSTTYKCEINKNSSYDDLFDAFKDPQVYHFDYGLTYHHLYNKLQSLSLLYPSEESDDDSISFNSEEFTSLGDDSEDISDSFDSDLNFKMDKTNIDLDLEGFVGQPNMSTIFSKKESKVLRKLDENVRYVKHKVDEIRSAMNGLKFNGNNQNTGNNNLNNKKPKKGVKNDEPKEEYRIEIDELHKIVEELNIELIDKEEIIEKDKEEIREKDKEIREKDKEIREKDKEIREKDKEIREKDKEIREKDKEIKEKDEEIKKVKIREKMENCNDRDKSSIYRLYDSMCEIVEYADRKNFLDEELRTKVIVQILSYVESIAIKKINNPGEIDKEFIKGRAYNQFKNAYNGIILLQSDDEEILKEVISQAIKIVEEMKTKKPFLSFYIPHTDEFYDDERHEHDLGTTKFNFIKECILPGLVVHESFDTEIVSKPIVSTKGIM